MSLVFKELTKGFGIKGPNDIIRFSFPLKEGVTKDQIEYHYPDCQVCTKVTYDEKTNSLKGTVELAKADQYIVGQKKPVNKYIFVALNDGVNQFKGKEGTLQRVPDPTKKIERIQIACVVHRKK